MRSFFVFLVFAVLLVPLTNARATTLDDIAARLDALERENAQLKLRVRELERRAAPSAAPALAATPAPTIPVAITSDKTALATEPPATFRERWDRTYVGIQGGHTVGEPEYPFLGEEFRGEMFSAEIKTESFGIQAGHSWQNGWFVAGVDLQARHEDIDVEARALEEYEFVENDDFYQYRAAGVARTEVPWSAAAKGRLGLATDTALLYVTGGVTAAQIDEEYESVTLRTVTAIGPGGTGDGSTLVLDRADKQTSSIQIGAIGGMGFEYALTDHLSLAAEYEYSWLGNRSFAPTGTDARLDWHSINARMNLSF